MDDAACWMEGSCGGIPQKRAGLARGADLQENSEDVVISEGTHSLLSSWDQARLPAQSWGRGDVHSELSRGFMWGCRGLQLGAQKGRGPTSRFSVRSVAAPCLQAVRLRWLY
jgi:hypothetical protein